MLTALSSAVKVAWNAAVLIHFREQSYNYSVVSIEGKERSNAVAATVTNIYNPLPPSTNVTLHALPYGTLGHACD